VAGLAVVYLGADDLGAAFKLIGDPAVVRGMCEDYRAGLRVDRDRHLRAGPMGRPGAQVRWLVRVSSPPSG
jgi:hypothetical protein